MNAPDLNAKGWLRPTQIEVGTGEPGYRWTTAYIVVSPSGTEFYPPMPKKEALAFARNYGFEIGPAPKRKSIH